MDKPVHSGIFRVLCELKFTPAHYTHHVNRECRLVAPISNQPSSSSSGNPTDNYEHLGSHVCEDVLVPRGSSCVAGCVYMQRAAARRSSAILVGHATGVHARPERDGPAE